MSSGRAALTIQPKTTATGVSGSLTVMALYILKAVWSIDTPPEVAAAATVIVASISAYLAPRAEA